MSKQNGQRIHKDQLRPATADEIALAQALEERFLQLCSTHFRLRGETLVPPKSMARDMVRWRTLRVRHREGDFRASDEEVQAICSLCQWTVAENCTLRGQPIAKVDWGGR